MEGLVQGSEPMTRVPKMARGKIFLACGNHCCANFIFFLLPDQRLYIVNNVCVCVCVCTHTHTHTHTHYSQYKDADRAKERK